MNKSYSALEEKWNVLTHGFGLFMSVVALLFLVLKAGAHDNSWEIISFSIYGMSMVILYAASTFYHREGNPQKRARLKIVDHAAIYVLIAGTYTPFTLVTLHGRVGWTLFGIVWGFALVGIIMKLFFTGRYNLLSTLMYVFMGWLAVFAIKPMINNLPMDGLYWLLAGGLAYTIGAVLYMQERIKFNHVIFHVFVLIGSFCHFMAVYFYVS